MPHLVKYKTLLYHISFNSPHFYKINYFIKKNPLKIRKTPIFIKSIGHESTHPVIEDIADMAI